MSSSLGGNIQVAIGDLLHFVYSTRNAGGTEAAWTTNPPTLYQVYQIDGTLITTGDSGGTAGPGSTSTRVLEEVAVPTDSGIYTPELASDYTVVSGDFPAGSVGYILLMDSSLTDFQAIEFRTVREAEIATSTAFIDLTQPSDGTVEASPNTLLGRVWTVEKNQRDVLMPRLKRILGHLGENCVVDAYATDDAGNITECRVRLFESKATRDAAQLYSDVINDADPAPSPEAGEIARYTINISNLLPRNLRTVFQQVISTESTDSEFGDLGSTGGSVL